MTYQELRIMFREHEASYPVEPLIAHIVFTADSFGKSYTKEQRTYEVSSKCKAFMPKMMGQSVYGSCIDGSDPDVRLDSFMGLGPSGTEGWQVEECYIVEKEEEI